MKTLFKSFSMLAVAACAGMSITSCTADKDLYNPEVVEQNVKSEYEANFIKKYGAVSPEQTWDFTSGPYTTLKSKESRTTRAAFTPTVTTSKDYYEVQNATLTWMQDQLTEGENNRSKGKPFVMSMPGNTFTIVPIFVGQASMSWDLHLVMGSGDNKVDKKIWSKNQDVQESADGKNWTNVTGNTLHSNNVRAKQYTVDNVPVGTEMYFYLEITVGGNNYAKKGKKQSSLDGMMVALNCPLPSNLPQTERGEDRKVMIIGCEDANLSLSDWDMNDVVFLVYGNPNIPEPIDITDETITQNIDKRYLIEDLGATDDFDFNDIVVDVKSSRSITYTKVNGVIDYEQTVYGNWATKATVQHRGGILPFTLNIGGTVINDIEPALGSDDQFNYDIPGWDPTKNEISITVRQNENEGVVTNIPFPKKGEVPMIIAVDPEQNWMSERVSIPKTWFTEE